jgi:GT2 family glycosyltransferase
VISKDLNYEIFIVDNNSNPEELEILNNFIKFQNYNNVNFITSYANLGFSGGNMLGAQNAVGEYYVFVNNDTLFYEDTFSKLYIYMQENKEIGVSTCISKNKDGINFECFDHFIGVRKIIFGRWLLESLFKKPKRRTKFTKPIEVDAIQGCFMFFDKKAFLEIKGFDEKIFLFYEEIDICKRLKDRGYKVVFNPISYFTHFQGASTKLSFLKKREET